MNLGKVKSFLILLFLGINIYLIATSLMSSRFYENKDTVKSCVELLSEGGITLETDKVPRFTANLRGVDTENAVYANEFVKGERNGFKTDGNRFLVTIKLNGFDEKTLFGFLQENGFDTKHMKISESKKADTKYIHCKIGKHTVFDSKIKVTQKDGLVTFDGVWYEPLSTKVHSNTKSRKTKYITSVLVSMLQNEEIMNNAPFEIKDISHGYLAGLPYGDEKHKTATAIPYYRIKDNKGNFYYFDASNGEYLSLK